MQTKSCLIVDDSRTVRSIASSILSDLSFKPIEAENGAEALEICRQAMPDAILMDWHMPVMNGLECLVELRKMPGGEQPVRDQQHRDQGTRNRGRQYDRRRSGRRTECCNE
ncbi:MAG: response regulator [Rhodospirillales bacterium]|nr:response regulator [Rhodospirillales bacterium]